MSGASAVEEKGVPPANGTGPAAQVVAGLQSKLQGDDEFIQGLGSRRLVYSGVLYEQPSPKEKKLRLFYLFEDELLSTTKEYAVCYHHKLYMCSVHPHTPPRSVNPDKLSFELHVKGPKTTQVIVISSDNQRDKEEWVQMLQQQITTCVIVHMEQLAAEEEADMDQAASPQSREALRILDEATKEVQALSKSALNALRANNIKTAPITVRKAVEGVGMVFGVDHDENGSYWVASSSLLDKSDFVRLLTSYTGRRAIIPDTCMQAISSLIKNPLLKPTLVAKSDPAAAVLWNWVRAFYAYQLQSNGSPVPDTPPVAGTRKRSKSKGKKTRKKKKKSGTLRRAGRSKSVGKLGRGKGKKKRKSTKSRPKHVKALSAEELEHRKQIVERTGAALSQAHAMMRNKSPDKMSKAEKKARAKEEKLMKLLAKKEKMLSKAMGKNWTDLTNAGTDYVPSSHMRRTKFMQADDFHAQKPQTVSEQEEPAEAKEAEEESPTANSKVYIPDSASVAKLNKKTSLLFRHGSKGSIKSKGKKKKKTKSKK